MEYLKFSVFTEEDFNEVIFNAGGRRYVEDDSVQTEKNCDYIIDDAVVELKIIEEEPLAKKTKQEKLAKLFKPEGKTVVLAPSHLDEKSRRKYYQELATPIKNGLKKASKQLQLSATRVNAKVRIAIIMNFGLTMTSPDEFEKIAIERAKNDTSGIDILIVSGMYYYSDKFEMYTIFNFKDILIQGEEYPKIINKLRKSFNSKTNDYMTMQMLNADIKRKKEPIQDLFFELNGIRYVKPPIQWGKSSSWLPNGRLREDSSNRSCTSVGMVLPIFKDNETYEYVRECIDNTFPLKSSFKEYSNWANYIKKSSNNIYEPLIHITLDREDITKMKIPFSIHELQNYAGDKFKNRLMNIHNNAIEHRDNVGASNVIGLISHEIGIDKANDIAFIVHIKDDDLEYKIYGEHLKFECALLLASSYCIDCQATDVYYYRDEEFKWK